MASGALVTPPPHYCGIVLHLALSSPNAMRRYHHRGVNKVFAVSDEIGLITEKLPRSFAATASLC
jgi:hypothetical protein